MSILFSKQCEYALQAITYIAMQPAQSMTSIKDLAATLTIPYHFLAKILQELTLQGLLFSQKGPNGGFGLAKPAQSITLLNVVEAIDGLDFANKCVMGFRHCDDSAPCAAHTHWRILRRGIHSMLAKRSLSQVAKEMKRTELTHARFLLSTNQIILSDIRVRHKGAPALLDHTDRGIDG